MRIALAGGGDARDSRRLDEVFAGWLGPHSRLLYLPLALRGVGSFQAGLEWLTDTLAPWHIRAIKMWTDLSKHQAAELERFDAVYVGGGNTFSLMAQIYRNGFDQPLRDFVRAGHCIYGGSAGAIMLGRDIRTARHLDSNEVGLVETGCLNLARGLTVWPHYLPSDDALIEAYVGFYHQPVLALSESSGAVLDANGFHSAGFIPAYRFDSRGKTPLPDIPSS